GLLRYGTLKTLGACGSGSGRLSLRRTRRRRKVRLAPISHNDFAAQGPFALGRRSPLRSRSARSSYFADAVSMICTKALGLLLCRTPEGQRYSGLGESKRQPA